MSTERKMSIKEMVIREFQKEPYFKDFIYKRKYSGIFRITPYGFQSVKFESGYNFPGESTIWVILGVRFRIISDWYESRFQEVTPDIHWYGQPFERVEINGEWGAEIHRNPELFSKEVKNLIEATVNRAKSFYARYDSVDSYYEQEVIPYIESGKDKFPSHEWRFICLLGASRVVSPYGYERVKELFYNRWTELKEKGIETTATTEILPKLNEIYTFMDNTDPADCIVRRRGEKEITKEAQGRRK